MNFFGNGRSHDFSYRSRDWSYRLPEWSYKSRDWSYRLPGLLVIKVVDPNLYSHYGIGYIATLLYNATLLTKVLSSS